MAEKRKLPARERREPAAKRRASEATPQQTPQTQSSSKKKAATPPPPPEPVVVSPPLPIKIKDGDALPTVPTPQQVASLSDKDYQSIAESAVLLASLERSKKKWLSDGILVRYWTKPKKTKREHIEGKNPPKESMSKVGPCHIMVGPHLFDCMLYTVKDPNAPPPIQYTPPQRPMVHYGHPNNFQQYQPYPPPPPPPPPQHTLPPQQHPLQTVSPGPPPPGYQPRGNQPMRPPSQQGRPPGHMSPPAHAPPPGPQQRPSPSQPAQPQPPKPSPDPVIQMLATRAASDPELKALMRVVASTEATQEQLRAFQAHIDELNAIIRAREQRQQQRQAQQATPTPRGYAGSPAPPAQTQPPPPPQQSPPAQPTPQSKSQPMQRMEVQIPRHSPLGNPPPQTPSQQPASQPQTPAPQTQVKQESGAATPTQLPSMNVPPPGPNPGIAPGAPPVHPNTKQSSPAVRSMPQPPLPQAAGPRPGAPYPPYQQPPYQGQPPPIHSRPPQYGSPATYYRQAPPPPPPRLNYKSVVFEFTSPLTPYGSSTSGHAGSGDRYLFPEYTILDWLPGGNTVLASFLVVRKVDPNTPFPLETATEIANSRAKGKSTKSKKSDKKEKGDDKTKEVPKPNPDPSSTAPDSKPATESDKPTEQDQNNQPPTTDPNTNTNNPDSTPKEDKKEPTQKEYYQPVTFRITSPNPKVLEPLTRVVKPADEVRRYMNEIMDRAERAPDGFLAVRLPREGSQHETVHVHEGGSAGTPIVSGAGARKSSRGKNVVVEQVDVVDTENEGVEEEEELRDYYGAPTGLSLW